MNERIWYKKYEPSGISGYVFQNKNTEKKILNYLEKGDIPNLLIDGIQGTGKSTLAKVLINELNIQPSDLRVINASNESGIDTVRERIDRFSKTYPVGKFKVVLLEEADGLSKAAQKALRSLIDESNDVTRYIFTCNYSNNIIPALLSRFQNIHVDSFDFDALTMHVADILDAEDISFDPDVLIKHVELYEPDLRKVINSIQECSTSGTLSSPSDNRSEKDDFIEKWKALWSVKSSYNDLYNVLGYVDSSNFEEVYEIMYSSKMHDDNNKAIPIIAEHLYKAYTVSNQIINIDACLIRLFNDL